MIDEVAREINAEPWEPPPGMVKLRCAACRYWFAAADPQAAHCPDCAIRQAVRLGWLSGRPPPAGRATP